MKASLKGTFIQSRFIHFFFFYCGAVTQSLGGLWKGILCTEKGSWCPRVQRWIAWGFLSRGSFDQDALHQTVSCLFPRMKRETSDIPQNVDDSPFCALGLCMRMNGGWGWWRRGGCCTWRVLWLLHWQHMGSLKGERGEQGVRGRRDFHPGFSPSRQARWTGLREWGGNSQPWHFSFFFLDKFIYGAIVKKILSHLCGPEALQVLLANRPTRKVSISLAGRSHSPRRSPVDRATRRVTIRTPGSIWLQWRSGSSWSPG